MKETDTISVLICVHSQDAEHDGLLEEALESLVRQTYCEFETVVVLDECWEDTITVVENYREVLGILSFQRPHKQGLAAAKNFGIKKCSGDWIAYLDADDQYMDCKLDVQRNWMLDNPNVDFCATHSWDRQDGYLVPNCFRVIDHLTHAQISSKLMHENVLCHGSMMIRRSALESLNLYSTSSDWTGREDWELWHRAVKSGFTFGKVAERLYIYSLGTSVAR